MNNIKYCPSRRTGAGARTELLDQYNPQDGKVNDSFIQTDLVADEIQVGHGGGLILLVQTGG